MTYIINGKKFSEETSEELYKGGFQQAMCSEDGEVAIYRSPKGTMWGTFKYWPNAFGAQNITNFVGEDSCRTYLERQNMTYGIEKVFGQLEEG